MTEAQRDLTIRYMLTRTIGADGKTHSKEDPHDVLRQLNESFGFNLKEQPDKVAAILEDAIHSYNAEDVECALDVAWIVGFRPAFLPLLVEIIGFNWHHSHEEIAGWFQHLKAPEAVEVLYDTALT